MDWSRCWNEWLAFATVWSRFGRRQQLWLLLGVLWRPQIRLASKVVFRDVLPPAGKRGLRGGPISPLSSPLSLSHTHTYYPPSHLCLFLASGFLSPWTRSPHPLGQLPRSEQFRSVLLALSSQTAPLPFLLHTFSVPVLCIPPPHHTHTHTHQVHTFMCLVITLPDQVYSLSFRERDITY